MSTDSKTSSERDTSKTDPQMQGPLRTWSAFFCGKAHLIFWSLAILGFVLDYVTKEWALKNIGPDEYGNIRFVNIIEDYVRFVLVFNEGASWGILSGKTGLLLAGSAVALVFVFWLFVTLHRRQRVAQVALGMLLGGAMGNTYDRIFRNGRVVDFFEVNFHFPPFDPFPAFNVADTLLCVGVGILILTMIFTKKSLPH